MRQAEMDFLASLGQRVMPWSRLPFLSNRAQCKKLCKDFLPPVVWRAAKKLRGKQDSAPGIVWQGDYPDWQSAVAASTGYDQDAIFTRVRDAKEGRKEGRKGSGCWISAEPLAAPIGSINPCWSR